MHEPSAQTVAAEEARIIRKRALAGAWASVVLTPVTMVAGTISSILIARALGAEQLAVVTALASVATTFVAFLDFGVTKSLVKILPDVAVRYGPRAALGTARKLSALQLSLFTLGWLVLVWCDATGRWTTREALGMSNWFLVLLGVRLLIMSLINVQRGIAASALHAGLSVRLNAVQAVLEPFVTVPIASMTGNPYAVIAAGFTLDAIQTAALTIFGKYDLDRQAGKAETPALVQLLGNYSQYVALTHVQFLFNRFIVGFSLIFWILASLGFDRTVIANAGIAFSLATQFWMVADLPYAQLQVPLLSRFHASNDTERFRRVKQLLSAVNVLTSCSLFVVLFGVGQPVFQFLYGEEYTHAVSWGMQGALLAMLLNLFSIGNRTLMQRDRYRPQVIGLCAASIAIAVFVFCSAKFASREFLPLSVLFSVIGGRGVFWVVTDFLAHREETTTGEVQQKLRGVLAVCVACAVIVFVSGDSLVRAGTVTMAALAFFFALFRLGGGIGEENRKLLSLVLGHRLQWVTNWC